MYQYVITFQTGYRGGRILNEEGYYVTCGYRVLWYMEVTRDNRTPLGASWWGVLRVHKGQGDKEHNASIIVCVCVCVCVCVYILKGEGYMHLLG